MFSSLQSALTQQLLATESASEIIKLHARLDLSDLNDSAKQALARLGLNWLSQQNAPFPHFFLKQRDQARQFACLGAVRTFDDLKSAQQFVEQHPFRLFGGLPFEGKPCFILPECLVAYQDEENCLSVELYLENSLSTEEQAVKIEQFCTSLNASFEVLSRQSQPAKLTPAKMLSSQSACDFAEWASQIEQVKQGIARGEFSKVVLANQTCLEFDQPISAYALLEASQQVNLGCYHFLWATSAEAAFIGSSPERLYQRAGNQFATEALAGTVAVTASEVQTALNAEWLLTDPKNLQENQLVVDDIQAQLSPYAERIEVSSPEIKRLHNVQHLRRRIQTQLKAGVKDAICLAHMHPTAAVAGLPRPPAKAFILQMEPFDRSWYAGTLGFFDQNEAEFCVTLRSAWVEDRHIKLYAGAGIVSGSEAEAEWLEIARKSRALASVLFP